MFDSGDSVDLSAFHHQPGLESEFAFTIGLTVRPGGPAMSAMMAREMVSTVHVAIELVCSRFEENFEVDPALLVADGALHAGLVLGPGSEPETVPDLVSHQLRTLVDGDEVATGTGAEVLGDPYESLAWLCNHLNKRGLTLPSGSVVTTGAATGLHVTGTGQEVATDGGTLGSVTLNLAG
jgi:2-keto-4-pentenoate hydratase